MWTLFSAKPSQIRVCWYVLAGPHCPLILNPGHCSSPRLSGSTFSTGLPHWPWLSLLPYLLPQHTLLAFNPGHWCSTTHELTTQVPLQPAVCHLAPSLPARSNSLVPPARGLFPNTPSPKPIPSFHCSVNTCPVSGHADSISATPLLSCGILGPLK